jgi:putative ABC transport system permease protein
VLSVGAIVVFLQLGYMQGEDMGFDRENVLVLDGDRYPVLKEALREIPGVRSVAGMPQVLGEPLGSSPYQAEGVPVDTSHTMLRLPATFDFVETMGMAVIAGRSFSEAQATDAAEGYMLNEAAVRALGWARPEEAVGKAFAVPVAPGDGGEAQWRHGHIVGVVRDFHHASLHHTIEPLVLYPSQDLNLTVVRLRNASRQTLARVGATWRQVNPDAPFNYYFLDARLRQAYVAEQQLAELFGAFTALALLVACLGLLGLAAYTAERRTREVGIRKAFGATILNIVGLMTIDFVGLVVIAVFIALPIAYFGLQRWLDHFAYHIEIGLEVFVMAGGAAVVIALTTVSYQAVKAALADPVDSLRYE